MRCMHAHPVLGCTGQRPCKSALFSRMCKTPAWALSDAAQTARVHPLDGNPSASGSPQDLLLSGSANMEVMYDGPGAGSGR